MSKTFALRCESCAALLTSRVYPFVCNFCGAENWANDSFSFAEQKTVATLRLICNAQATFQATSGNGGYATANELSALGLISQKLAEAFDAPNDSEICRAQKSKSMFGYRFQLKTFDSPAFESARFSVLATVDLETHKQGKWNFYVDQTGVIRFSRNLKVSPNENSEVFDEQINPGI